MQAAPDGATETQHSAGVDRAIYIAAGAHNGQIDKAGAPYIHHVLRVVAAVSGEDAKIVAALHDVLEDCADWTPQRLRDEGFAEHVVDAVKTLTRRDEESYEAFIDRVAANPLATQVKLADLADNSNLGRLSEVRPSDRLRVEKYARAIARLSREAPRVSPAEGRAGTPATDEHEQADVEGLVERLEPVAWRYHWTGDGRPVRWTLTQRRMVSQPAQPGVCALVAEPLYSADALLSLQAAVRMYADASETVLVDALARAETAERRLEERTAALRRIQRILSNADLNEYSRLIDARDVAIVALGPDEALSAIQSGEGGISAAQGSGDGEAVTL